MILKSFPLCTWGAQRKDMQASLNDYQFKKVLHPTNLMDLLLWFYLLFVLLIAYLFLSSSFTSRSWVYVHLNKSSECSKAFIQWNLLPWNLSSAHTCLTALGMTCTLLSKYCFSAHPTENVHGKVLNAQRYQNERYLGGVFAPASHLTDAALHMEISSVLFMCGAAVFFIGGWEPRSKNKACLTVPTFRYI